MSAARRVLRRLSNTGAMLMVMPNGGYGLFLSGDRRRRPVGRLSAAEVREAAASGALGAQGEGCFVLTEAGRALLRREDADDPSESYLQQHKRVRARHVVEEGGETREVRAVEASDALRRLKSLRGGDGSPWLSSEELSAATRLHEDWLLGQVGLIGGSNWSAPPRGASPRGPGNAREGALAAHCDARARVADALDALAAPLRRVVERVCLREEGLEALERAENWPARSGKIALKLGLAQLARMRR